jgi:hypothetical protein
VTSALAALTGGPVQIAYGVTNIEEAARTWSETLGAGPFFVRHHISVEQVTIDGVPGVFDHSSAYGQWGSVMVELVEVHTPSQLAATGLHHLAYFVDSFDDATTELVGRGWPAALSAIAGTTRFAFHDARHELGHFVEIYEPSSGLVDFYAMVADAAKDWNGADPVRLLG